MAKSNNHSSRSRAIDSVELKMTVPTGSEWTVAHKLNLDILDAHIRQVFFFDTPDLALSKKGVFLRARRVQADDHDSVVKIRPVTPGEIDSRWRKMDEYKIEVDVVAGKTICSGSLKAFPRKASIVEAIEGKVPVEKIFTKDQKEYLAQHAPEVYIPWDTVIPLGPVNVLKLKSLPPKFGYKVTSELWRYPDGSALLELSTKCHPAEAFQVQSDAREYMETMGFTLGDSAAQETKTKRALAFFSKQGSPAMKARELARAG